MRKSMGFLFEVCCEIRWMEEILHQLIDGKHPILEVLRNHPFGGAGVSNHPGYDGLPWR